MSVLLIDIGNTRIKWARLRDGRLSRQQAVEHASWTAEDVQREVFKGMRGVERVVAVSVAADAVNRSVVDAARRAFGVDPEFVASQRRAGGVTTRYFEPWRLGADRFMAVIGAHAMAKPRGACVVDVGTAMTIDLVDGRGRHHGGVIVPGPDLMVHSLLNGTNGIAHRARGGSAGRALFARETRAAVEQGARHAAAAAVDRAVFEARRVLGARPLVFLTGGAAKRLHPLILSPHVSVADLVLRGLAVSMGLRVD